MSEDILTPVRNQLLLAQQTKKEEDLSRALTLLEPLKEEEQIGFALERWEGIKSDLVVGLIKRYLHHLNTLSTQNLMQGLEQARKLAGQLEVLHPLRQDLEETCTAIAANSRVKGVKKLFSPSSVKPYLQLLTQKHPRTCEDRVLDPSMDYLTQQQAELIKNLAGQLLRELPKTPKHNTSCFSAR